MKWGGWTVSSIIGLESGFPIAIASATNNTGLFSRTQRANPTGADPVTNGSRETRILNRWLNPAAYEVPPAFTLGTGPRTDGRVRGPHRNNVDLAVMKAVPLGGRLTGEVRLEVLNLTNTVKVIGPLHTASNAAFGQIRTQSGFMRITQVMVRIGY